MSRLFGSVLVKETNAGIPNLVVSAFDQDPAARGDAAAVDDRHEFQGIDGARLGSVITGPGGSFELEYDTWTKGRPGSEIRPNLVLAVFAPEDSSGTRDPRPRLPQQRLLHVSRVPRVDASPIEGYVIRLLRSQLAELGIGLPNDASSRDAHLDADRLTGSIERSWTLRDAVRERLQPRIDREAKLAEERKKQAKAWARSLVLTQKTLREHPLFAPDRESAAKAHERAIKEGLNRLKSYQPRLRLNLSENDLRALGLLKEDGTLAEKVSLDKLNPRIFAGSGSPDLIRRRDLSNTTSNPQRRLNEILETVAAEKAAAEKAAAERAAAEESDGGPQ